MANIAIEDLADLTAATLRQLNRGRWTDLTTDLQEHFAMPRMLRRDKVKFDTGYGHQWNVMVGTSGNARNVGEFADDQLNIDDNFVQARIDYRHTEGAYGWTKTEFLANMASPQQVFDLIKSRRVDGWVDLAGLMETDWWGTPTSDDNLTPYGIAYFIVPNTSGSSAATGAGEFGGGTQFGDTVANINPTTYPRWKNWTHQYVDVSKEDLITKMRLGAYKTRFKPPVDIPTYAKSGRDRAYFAPYTVVATMERLAENQNDNLGNDLASKDGKVIFRGAAVNPVPQLDSDSTNPVYQIDFSEFFPCFLKGDYLVETKPKARSGKHRVIEVFIDATWTACCRNRRAQAVYTL